jgi:hypothetical protein
MISQARAPDRALAGYEPAIRQIEKPRYAQGKVETSGPRPAESSANWRLAGLKPDSMLKPANLAGALSSHHGRNPSEIQKE